MAGVLECDGEKSAYARLSTLATRKVRFKDVAVDWALAHLPMSIGPLWPVPERATSAIPKSAGATFSHRFARMSTTRSA